MRVIGFPFWNSDSIIVLLITAWVYLLKGGFVMMPPIALHHTTSGNQTSRVTHEHKGTILSVAETDSAVETKAFSMEV